MTIRGTLRRLGRDTRGLALIEFALVLPILVVMCLAGAELTNYITVKMRVSQLALKIADDAARMGNGSLLAAKTIEEVDINDLFVGANLQSGELELARNGRVVLSDLEPVANPNRTNRYRIRWQRCYGAQAYTPTYGTAGQTNLTGMGPAGRQSTATDDNATMFVEVFYRYRPLIDIAPLEVLVPSERMIEIASMSVRDRRDLSGGNNGIYNDQRAPVASC